MKLYHFTNLLHLPSILREGITKGEVPLDPRTPYNKLPQAPNLTSNGNPHQQSWTGGLTDKTKVRLTVEVLDEDLTTFRQVRDKYGIRASWLKRLRSDPVGYYSLMNQETTEAGQSPGLLTLFCGA